MNKHKKTRQEKIISDLRKQIAFQRVNNSPSQKDISQKISSSDTSTTKTTYSFPAPKENLTYAVPTARQMTVDYSYVSKDLRKTFVLTFLALGVELIVYYVWR